MSVHNTSKAAQSADVPYAEQKQIIVSAIQQRFPAVKFKEWSYYEIGELFNTHKVGGITIAHYQDFFTQLLLFLAKHGLTDSFFKDVDNMGVTEHLSNFFLLLAESPDLYQAFVDYYHLDLTHVDKETMTALAMDYLYGPEMERIIEANKE